MTTSHSPGRSCGPSIRWDTSSSRMPGSSEGGSSMALQESQRLVIELGDIFVERRVRAALEDQELGIADAGLQSIGKTRRRQLIVAPERDQRRRADSSEMRVHVMSEHGVRLLDEVRD